MNLPSFIFINQIDGQNRLLYILIIDFEIFDKVAVLDGIDKTMFKEKYDTHNIELIGKWAFMENLYIFLLAIHC